MTRQLQTRTLAYTRTSPQRAAGRARRAPYRGLEYDLDTGRADIAGRQPFAHRAQRTLRVYAWVAAGAGLALLVAAALAAVAGLAAAGMAFALALGVALVAGLVLWTRRSGSTPTHRRIP